MTNIQLFTSVTRKLNVDPLSINLRLYILYMTFVHFHNNKEDLFEQRFYGFVSFDMLFSYTGRCGIYIIFLGLMYTCIHGVY